MNDLKSLKIRYSTFQIVELERFLNWYKNFFGGKK